MGSHDISLKSMLRAAWSLRLADALPGPSGVSVRRLVEGGGMRPWLRLAIGEDLAARLTAEGRCGWHMGALLGLDGRSNATLSHPGEEAASIRFVEGLCEEFASPVWSLASAERDRIHTYGDHGCLEVLDRASASADPRAVAGPLVSRALETLALAHGIDLSNVAPADVSQWERREIETEVILACGARSGIGGNQLEVVVRTPDGHVLGVPHVFEWIAVGERLLVTTAGAFGDHPGYVIGYRRMRDVELSREVAAILAGEKPPEMPPCVDASGRVLQASDRVVLLHGCLEEAKGARGEVIETYGNMASVIFEGSDGEVPCYGIALEARPSPVART